MTVRRGAIVVATALLLAVALGAIRMPDVAGAIEDATAPLGAWIYLVVLAFIFFETTLLLGFLIHGELVLMLSGVAAARGDASLAVLIAVAWAGALLGDLVGLLMGRRLGRPFLERHGRRVGLAAVRLERLDGFFTRHGRKALFLGRFTGFLRSTMPFVLGTTGMTVRRLVPVSAASALVWTGTFTVIGYAVAESFERAGQTATRITSAAIVVAIAAFVIQARVQRARSV